MKKKISRLLAGAVVCAMLAACGASEQKSEPADQNSQTQQQAQENVAESPETQAEVEALTSQAQDDASLKTAHMQSRKDSLSMSAATAGPVFPNL